MVRTNLAFSLLGSGAGLVTQVGVTAYVARVLTPAEAGVFAVASVFLALAVSCRDFGVAEYLIQHAEVTPGVVRASLAVNYASSWAVALLLAAGAPAVAAFYASQAVAQVMLVQALGVALIPFGAVTMAWFRREMQARPLLLAQLAAQCAQALVSAGGVALGWGVMALAWGSVAGVLATVVVAARYRPAWLPRWPMWQGSSEVVRFGRYASGVFVANQAGRGAPDLVMGRVLGLDAAGMFSRATGVVELFNRLVMQAVQPVCMPYLADSLRAQGTLAPGFLRATSLLTGVGWPWLALLGGAAYPAVRLMYGPQWLDAVPAAQILCLAAMVELLYRLTEEALFALGDSRRAQRLLFRVQGLRLLGVLAGVAAGATVGQGLAGAACGLLLAACLGAAVQQRALARFAGVSLHALWSAVRPGALMTLIAALPVAVLHRLWPVAEAQYVPWGLAAAGLGLSAWAFAAWALAHPVWIEVQRAWRLVRQRLGPAGGQAEAP